MSVITWVAVTVLALIVIVVIIHAVDIVISWRMWYLNPPVLVSEISEVITYGMRCALHDSFMRIESCEERNNWLDFMKYCHSPTNIGCYVNMHIAPCNEKYMQSLLGHIEGMGYSVSTERIETGGMLVSCDVGMDEVRAKKLAQYVMAQVWRVNPGDSIKYRCAGAFRLRYVMATGEIKCAAGKPIGWSEKESPGGWVQKCYTYQNRRSAGGT
jgi:hypothetical protein